MQISPAQATTADVANAPVARDPSGNIAVNAITLTAGQIAFPAVQNSSAGANTLDDYEEGTWTPTVVGATIVGTPTYDGHYTKIGRLVRFVLYITSTTSFATSGRSSTTLTLPTTQLAGTGGTGIIKVVNAGSLADYGQNIIATTGVAYFPTIPATSDIIVTGEYHSAT